MSVQTYFRNLGVALTWFERLAIVAFQKKLILFGVLGFIVMVSGTFFSMFLLTGHYDVKFFFLSAIVFVITFRYFSFIVKKPGVAANK